VKFFRSSQRYSVIMVLKEVKIYCIYEGSAIGVVITGQKFPRPLTHDLLVNILEDTKVKIEKVAIMALKDSTFYAEIHLSSDGKKIVIDARPSDSMAVALRAPCPIFVNEEVFGLCPELLKPISNEEVNDFKKKLVTMTPEDFFKDLKKNDKKDED